MHAQNVHVRIALAVGVITFAIAAGLGLASITLPAPSATRNKTGWSQPPHVRPLVCSRICPLSPPR